MGGASGGMERVEGGERIEGGECVEGGEYAERGRRVREECKRQNISANRCTIPILW